MFALGSFADKTSSKVHHILFTSFEEYQPTGTYSNLNGTGKRCDKNFCGLSSKKLTNRSNSPDLKKKKKCGLANSVDLLRHGEPSVKHDT